VVHYYDHTWFDYRWVWRTGRNRSLHFGYHDDKSRGHSDAILNLNRVLATEARIEPGERVLDAGCGVGGSALWLAGERGAQVVGITPVEGHVGRANAAAAEAGAAAAVRFEVGNYAKTRFPDASFDVVWALESLCHASDKPAIYREFARVLRPGGRLVMAEYLRHSRDLPAAGERLVREWLDGWAIPDIDTEAEHQDAARDAGFVDVVVRDVTENTRPSLRRLYHLSHLGVPIDAVLHRLGLRNRVQHGNVVGARRQYQALARGCWFYSIVSAVKGPLR
jgi:tocopherol O-methyltransferase